MNDLLSQRERDAALLATVQNAVQALHIIAINIAKLTEAITKASS